MGSGEQGHGEGRSFDGALWLGITLVSVIATSSIWEGPSQSGSHDICVEDCIRVQVLGLEGREGVYRVPDSMSIREFLGRIGLSGEGVDAFELQDWTCLDFRDSSVKTPPKVGRMRESAKYLLGYPMDLNRAEMRDLMMLPGIGPSLARRIVRERGKGGPFASPADLARVKGIPKNTLEGIKPFLVVATEPVEAPSEGVVIR